MQKKKFIMLLLSVILLGIYLNYDSFFILADNRIMAAEVLPKEKLELLFKGKEDSFLEPAIKLNDGQIAYDTEQNMLLIPQDLAENRFDGILSVPEGDLYFLEDEGLKDKAGAVSDNKIFRLYWVTEDRYWMYNVFFSGMPVISMTTEEINGESSIGKVWVYDQYHTGTQFQSAEGDWHNRGQTSLNYEKKSYKLNLTDKKLSLLGMRKDDDWILSSLYDDEGLIHNKLSYRVWQEIAAHNDVHYDEGIDMEYIELFLDNEYLGVYGLLERIDKKELSLNSRDILYKCRAHGLPTEDDFYSVLTDDINPTFVLESPNEFTMEDWEPIKSWIDYFCHDGLTDFETGEALLNMENAIDYNLFGLLINGTDNDMKNIYFEAEYQTDGTYQFVKIPWDLNMTWGNSWVDDLDCNFNMYQEKNITNTSGWSRDISHLYYLNPEKIAGDLRQRWKELRKDIITGDKLYRMLDEEFSYLYSTGAIIRNRQKWPPKGEYWSDQYIYDYIDGRIDYLDSYLEQLYTDCMTETVYQGVDYSDEFEARYYYEYNYHDIKDDCTYNKQELLEHYVLYGKEQGLIAKWNTDMN